MRLFSLQTLRVQLFAALALSPFAVMAVAPEVAHAQDPASQNASRTDAQIQSDVTTALSRSSTLKDQEITAATINGNVTLSGNVSDAASKELAEMLTLKVGGVNAVSNNLTINGQADPGSPAAEDAQRLPPVPVDPGQDPQDAQQNAAAAPQDGPPAPMNGQPGYGQPGDGQPGYGQPGDGQPGYPPPPRAPYAPRYPNQYPPSGAPEQATSGPVQVPQGTLLNVRLSEFLDARRVQQGTVFETTAASDVYSGGVLAIPRGAVIQGQVVDVKPNTKGSLAGSAGLTLKLNTLQLGGQTYALNTDVWSSSGPGKGAYSANNTIGGAAIGAIIGGIAGGGLGAGIGAAAGGATGAIGSAASSGPRMVLPPEAVLTFHLANAITVQPVSYQEAQRLASASQPGRPDLQRRPGYPGYGYAPVPYGYPGYGYPVAVYGYPYRYYRPYYYGGYYRR